MPTYEYECKTCNKVFEMFQNMSDKPLSKCPDCGKKVKRLIGGGAGLIFKGSGFHATDYRSSDYQSKAQADNRPCGDSSKTPPCQSGGKCCAE